MTKQACGKTVDLAQERNLYLDYEGAELGGYMETCEIKIQNSSPDEMICITTLNPPLYKKDYTDCMFALMYNVSIYYKPLKAWHTFLDIK